MKNTVLSLIIPLIDFYNIKNKIPLLKESDIQLMIELKNSLYENENPIEYDSTEIDAWRENLKKWLSEHFLEI